MIGSNVIAKVDLHGIKHRDVAKFIHDLVVKVDVPFFLITGHSPEMRRLALEALEPFNLTGEVLYYNHGVMIVDVL